jgi:hypothetical protein
MNKRQLLSVDELEALLARPAQTDLSTDKFFPLRLWLVWIAGLIWFIRLTVFTDEVASSLFTDPLVREYMKSALYFRAWIMFAFMFIGFIAYKTEKYPALFFLAMFTVGSINFIADMTIFYKDQFANPTIGFNLLLVFRFFMCYLMFVSVRNANRIPKGDDKWNPFLPFKRTSAPQT